VSSVAPIAHALTYRDLANVPDDGNRWEVVDGVLHVTPFPTYAHQNAVTQLVTVLNQHVRTHGLGRVFTSGLMVVLDEPTGVGPDVVYVSAARMSAMREDGYHGAPDLCIEVLSSKPDLDRTIKLQKYARSGIPHYWIVDPVAHVLWAHRLDGGEYRLAMRLEQDAIFEPELFPGLRLTLADLWV
jgi:Uma2 family endonuclease